MLRIERERERGTTDAIDNVSSRHACAQLGTDRHGAKADRQD
jgi:hypothetical protein